MSRRLRPLAVFAMVAAMIAAGCASTPAETGAGGSATRISTPTTSPSRPNAPAEVGAGGSGGNTNVATREQGVKFAQCMRDSGVKEFPDPDASGALTIDGIVNGSSLDSNSAAWKKAISACKDLQPPGFTGGKRSPEQQAAALKFAQCVRDNGVKDFPDPVNGEPLVDTNRIPSTARSGGLSILHAAMQKCRGVAADAGVSQP